MAWIDEHRSTGPFLNPGTVQGYLFLWGFLSASLYSEPAQIMKSKGAISGWGDRGGVARIKKLYGIGSLLN